MNRIDQKSRSRKPRRSYPAAGFRREGWMRIGDGRDYIPDATIRQNMGKHRCIAAQSRIRPLFLPLILLLNLAFAGVCHAQMGVATGNGVATPAKPLPAGMKAPVVRYEDIADQAGLAGVNISGADKNKQYIVETTGTGVAIVDYDNDGLPDILLVNGDRFQQNGTPPTPLL